MGSRGDRTREHLLDVAEQLFGESGVTGVSLRQIRIAAGQGNEGAVQYHFGDRAGVLAALAARHRPRVEAIAARLRARLDGREPTDRELVELFVRPLADYVEQGASARAWVRVVADRTSDPRISFGAFQDHASPQAAAVGLELVQRLERRMPRRVAVTRVWTVAQLVIHVCADRARLMDDPAAARQLDEAGAFVANLVDMALGALTAPVTPTPSG